MQVSTLGLVDLGGAGDTKELLLWRDQHRTKMKRRSLLQSEPTFIKEYMHLKRKGVLVYRHVVVI